VCAIECETPSAVGLYTDMDNPVQETKELQLRAQCPKLLANFARTCIFLPLLSRGDGVCLQGEKRLLLGRTSPRRSLL